MSFLVGVVSGFWFGFSQHLFEFTFLTFAVDDEPSIFGGPRGYAMREMHDARLFIRRGGGCREGKMGSASTFMRRCSAMAWKTHTSKKTIE